MAPIQKNIKETLSLWEELVNAKSVVIIKPGDPLDRTLGTFSKSATSGFELTYQDFTLGSWNRESIENLELETTNYSLLVNKAEIDDVQNSKVTSIIEAFSSSEFSKSKKSKYRLVLRMWRELPLRFYIENLTFRTHDHSSRQLLRLSLKSIVLDIYIYKARDGKSFLICDSDGEVQFETFSQICYSCLISLGYITGRLLQGEGFYFSYLDNELSKPVDFHFQEFRKSSESIYSPIYANAGGFLKDPIKIKEINSTLRPMTMDQFSSLCNWAIESIDFTAILLVILEACSSSLGIMPSALSVALEGLTELIISEKEESFAPITDKALAKTIKKALIAELGNFEEKVGKEGTAILADRINNINQITNKAKLTKPFHILKFDLTPEDVRAIEHRNDFLHGRIVSLPGKKNDEKLASLNASTQEIYYIALRLYTLLAVLILKSVKYDNKIVNHPRLQSHIYTEFYPYLKEESIFRQL